MHNGTGRVPIIPLLEHRLAPVIDTDRMPLRAIRHERRKQIGELGVPAVLRDESLDLVPLPAVAWLADRPSADVRNLATDVCRRHSGNGQRGLCAIATYASWGKVNLPPSSIKGGR